jgi:hypothetical protein
LLLKDRMVSRQTQPGNIDKRQSSLQLPFFSLTPQEEDQTNKHSLKEEEEEEETEVI